MRPISSLNCVSAPLPCTIHTPVLTSSHESNTPTSHYVPRRRRAVIFPPMTLMVSPLDPFVVAFGQTAHPEWAVARRLRFRRISARSRRQHLALVSHGTGTTAADRRTAALVRIVHTSDATLVDEFICRLACLACGAVAGRYWLRGRSAGSR